MEKIHHEVLHLPRTVRTDAKSMREMDSGELAAPTISFDKDKRSGWLSENPGEIKLAISGQTAVTYTREGVRIRKHLTVGNCTLFESGNDLILAPRHDSSNVHPLINVTQTLTDFSECVRRIDLLEKAQHTSAIPPHTLVHTTSVTELPCVTTALHDVAALSEATTAQLNPSSLPDVTTTPQPPQVDMPQPHTIAIPQSVPVFTYGQGEPVDGADLQNGDIVYLRRDAKLHKVVGMKCESHTCEYVGTHYEFGSVLCVVAGDAVNVVDRITGRDTTIPTSADDARIIYANTQFVLCADQNSITKINGIFTNNLVYQRFNIANEGAISMLCTTYDETENQIIIAAKVESNLLVKVFSVDSMTVVATKTIATNLYDVDNTSKMFVLPGYMVLFCWKYLKVMFSYGLVSGMISSITGEFYIDYQVVDCLYAKYSNGRIVVCNKTIANEVSIQVLDAYKSNIQEITSLYLEQAEPLGFAELYTGNSDGAKHYLLVFRQDGVVRCSQIVYDKQLCNFFVMDVCGLDSDARIIETPANSTAVAVMSGLNKYLFSYDSDPRNYVGIVESVDDAENVRIVPKGSVYTSSDDLSGFVGAKLYLVSPSQPPPLNLDTCGTVFVGTCIDPHSILVGL